MSKPKKKRFRTAQQINDEIEKYKVKAQKFMDAAAALDYKADQIIQNRSGELGSLAGEVSYARSQAADYRKKAQGIKDRRLPYLKGKLAEFQTKQLPGIDDHDNSIPA